MNDKLYQGQNTVHSMRKAINISEHTISYHTVGLQSLSCIFYHPVVPWVYTTHSPTHPFLSSVKIHWAVRALSLLMYVVSMLMTWNMESTELEALQEMIV